MYKNRIAATVICFSLLTFLMFSQATSVQANYTRFNIHYNFSGSFLGDDTNILNIILETDMDNYHFNATNQTITTIDENENLIEINIFTTINDNYAPTGITAASRSRVNMTITNPAGENVMDNRTFINFVGADNGTFFTVNHRSGTLVDNPPWEFDNNLLEIGDWDIRLEYDIFTVIENL